MQYLFQSWQEFSAEVAAARHFLLLSDYDGTLTPIVGRPEDAVLSFEVRNKLNTLARKTAVSVGIISGRSMTDLKAMVAIDGIYYAGNHGLEIEGPDLEFISEPARVAQELMKKLAGEMVSALENIDGVIVEDKGLSLSVHYRLVKEEEENTVAEVFRRLTRPLLADDKVRVASGKKVYEVRPPIDWHKGKAVESIIREIKSALGLERVLAAYLGDDTTDEDAFRTLRRPEGWSIFVGKENPLSAAEYYLGSTSEVGEFLSRLIVLK